MSELQRGDEVCHIGDPSRRGIIIDGPRHQAGAAHYRVEWGARRRSWQPAAMLVKHEPETLGWASRDKFLVDLVLSKFFHEFSDVLFSIGSSRTEFLVYQFKPVLQFVRRASHGLLIADEVGLGKTIESALIVRELMARGDVERLLIVCPANLRRKWRSELQQRFGIELREMRARDFEDLRDRFEREGDWPGFFGVTSLEGLRITDFERTLVETDIPFDLVIVDEAHHLRNPATRSFSLGEVLSDQSAHILLLSATPIQTGQSDLLSLLRIVEPAEFGGTSQEDLDALLEPNRHINAALARLSQPEPNLSDVAQEMRGALATEHGAGFGENAVFMSWLRRLEDVRELNPEATVRLRRDLQRMHTLAPYYTRTRKREVQETAERMAQVVRVTLTAAEQEFYDAWVEFLIERALALNPNAPPEWRITQFERTAASSLQAAHERMEALIADLDIGEDYEGTDSETVNGSGGGHPQSPALEEAVHRLRAAAADLPERDSKLDSFIELVERLLAEKPKRKILVFTFFRSTLQYLKSRLRAAGIGCASVWGGDAPEQRGDIIDDFRENPDMHVLVSTEVGSEGLDFQFCDAVVNYDLPWNPMRVEQRIGRIDRFGQREPQVVVASFFAEETIDTRILERLYTRIGVFEHSIGELEPILGPEISALQADAFTRGLTAEQQERRANDALLRIEQRKQHKEEFESARAELMGQGDLLNQEIEGTRSSGRYVSPAEIQAVVDRWLQSGEQRRGTLRPTPRDSVFDLRLSDEAVAGVRHYMSVKRVVHPDTQSLLRHIQENRHRWVTFDDEVSREYDGLPFLNIGHPIVLTAIDEIQKEEPPDWIARVGSFAVPTGLTDTRTRGGVALAIFRLGIHGRPGLNGPESQETLLPVVVSLSSHESCSDLGDALLGALATAAGSPPPVALDEPAIRELEDTVFEHAEKRRQETQDIEREQFAGRIAVQRATLRRTSEARIRRAEARLDQASDARIIRLYEGQIRNLNADLERRIRELDELPEPAAEIDLLSMAILSAEN